MCEEPEEREKSVRSMSKERDECVCGTPCLIRAHRIGCCRGSTEDERGGGVSGRVSGRVGSSIEVRFRAGSGQQSSLALAVRERLCAH